MAGRTVLFPFLGTGIGGSHVATFALASELLLDGDRCIFLCAGHNSIAERAAQLGFEVVDTHERPATAANGRHPPAYDATRFATRLAFLRRWRGTGAVVHCNDLATLTSWGLAARLLGYSVIYHHHSLNRMIWPNRMMVKLASGVIFVSEACRENLPFLPLHRTKVVLNPFDVDLGIDRDEARREVIGRHGLPGDSRLVGFVGNFWHRKRPCFFLDVCQAIAANDPRARFVIFGRKGEMSEDDLMTAAARLGIADRTILAGFQLPGERNIAALDLMLAPAVREPFGRTLVEALLVGTPYVATRDAGHAEIHERWGGGLVLETSTSASAFAEAALSALDDPLRVVLPIEARRAAAAELASREHMLAVTEFYDDMGRGRLRQGGGARKPAVAP
jgi:glycosyltransferase involved in cell wall biosynthesis